MAEDVKKLLLQIDASVELLKRNLANGDAHVEKFERDAKRRLDTIDRRFATFGSPLEGRFRALRAGAASFGLGLSLVAVTAVAKRALDYASSLGEVSQQLGVTTKDLQVYRYAASQVGIEQEEMDKGLSKLTQNMGKAEVGSKPLAAAFGAIGISLADLKGKTAGEIMPRIADGLAKIPDPARRAAVEVALFGKAGQKLDTLLSSGGEGIRQFRKEAEDLGLVLSEEQIRNADKTADNLGKLNRQLQARIAGIVADNAESILKFALALSSLAAGLSRFWSQNPGAALQLLGAGGGVLVGARIGGLPGAAVGGGLGLAAGVYAYGQTPQGLKEQAEQYRQTANKNARALGFRGDGSERDRMIARMPIVATMTAAYRKKKAEAEAAARGNNVVIPAADAPKADGGLPNFLGGSGRKGKTSDQLAAEQERQRKEGLRQQYNLDRDELNGKRDLLSAQRDLQADFVDRNLISRELLDLDHDARAREIQFNLDMDLADRSLSDAQKEAARTTAAKQGELNDQLTLLRKQSLNYQEELERARGYDETEAARYGAARDRLEAEAGLATTIKERRRIELEILDITDRERREKLERLLAAQNPDGSFAYSDSERVQAQIALNNLPARHEQDRQAALQRNRGPLADYMASIPRTADEVNEALERVEAEGLKSLEDGITDAIMGARSLGDVFDAVSKQIIAALIRIAVQRAIIEPLANTLFGPGGEGSSAGTGGSILGSIGTLFGLGGGHDPRHFGHGAQPGGGMSIMSAISSAFGGGMPGFSISGFANGGDPPVGRPSWVGERGPELFYPKVPGRIIPNHALGGGGPTVNVAYHLNAQGADPAAIARLESLMIQHRRQLPSDIVKVVREAIDRRAI